MLFLIIVKGHNMWLLIYLIIILSIVLFYGKNIIKFERERKHQILESKSCEDPYCLVLKYFLIWFFVGSVLFLFLFLFWGGVNDEARDCALFFVLFLNLISCIFLAYFEKLYKNIRSIPINQNMQGICNRGFQFLSLFILGIISVSLVLVLPFVYRADDFVMFRYTYYEKYAQKIFEEDILAKIPEAIANQELSDLKVTGHDFQYVPELSSVPLPVVYDVVLRYESQQIDSYYEEIMESSDRSEQLIRAMIVVNQSVEDVLSDHGKQRLTTWLDSIDLRYRTQTEIGDFGILIHGDQHTYKIESDDTEFNILYIDDKKVYVMDHRPKYIPIFRYEKPKKGIYESSSDAVHTYDDGYNAVYEDGGYDEERYNSDPDYATGVDDAILDVEEDFGEVW